MFERYAFLAITTKDLEKSKTFWTETLEFKLVEEEKDRFCMIDVGGLRLCIDLEDEEHKAGSSDPIVGLKVSSLSDTLSILKEKGIEPVKGPIAGSKGQWATIQDPDHRTIVLTEHD